MLARYQYVSAAREGAGQDFAKGHLCFKNMAFDVQNRHVPTIRSSSGHWTDLSAAARYERQFFLAPCWVGAPEPVRSPHKNGDLATHQLYHV